MDSQPSLSEIEALLEGLAAKLAIEPLSEESCMQQLVFVD
jgi:hypothetical protein